MVLSLWRKPIVTPLLHGCGATGYRTQSESSITSNLSNLRSGEVGSGWFVTSVKHNGTCNCIGRGGAVFVLMLAVAGTLQMDSIDRVVVMEDSVSYGLSVTNSN